MPTSWLECVSVPFLDLGPTHADLKSLLLSDISDLIESGQFVNGPLVHAFERSFAKACGVGHCVGVSSGLDALRLSLLASGIEGGDEVLVPAMTFVATFEAVTQAGGRPVVVDVLDDEYTMNPALAEAAVTSRTSFVLPVHLYGQMADVMALRRLAHGAGLGVVEDAAQAHNAERDGLTAGGAGAAGAFSFYPGKNLGALGDAGAVVTDDEAVASTVRALREHGQTSKYRHEMEGYTARLDALQALVLLRKLPLLNRWTAVRREIASRYSEGLAGLGDLGLPGVPHGSSPVWHLYVVRTSKPEKLAEFLRSHGIGSGRHYPTPPHLTPAYAHLGYSQGDFPVAEQLAREALSLPLFPGMTEGQIDTVVRAVRSFFRHPAS